MKHVIVKELWGGAAKNFAISFQDFVLFFFNHGGYLPEN